VGEEGEESDAGIRRLNSPNDLNLRIETTAVYVKRLMFGERGMTLSVIDISSKKHKALGTLRSRPLRLHCKNTTGVQSSRHDPQEN
jgi:hypothetical protein